MVSRKIPRGFISFRRKWVYGFLFKGIELADGWKSLIRSSKAGFWWEGTDEMVTLVGRKGFMERALNKN